MNLKNVVVLQSVLLALAMSASAQGDVITGLVGHWRLDETNTSTLIDSTGNSSGGIIFNDASNLGQTGMFGNAFQFDGETDADKVNVNTQTVVPATGDFSIFAWIRTSASMGDGLGDYVFNNYIAGNPGRSALQLLNGQVSWFVDSDVRAAGPTVNDGQWHLIGVTRESGDFRLWADGIDYDITDGGSVGQTDDWYIGGRVADDLRNVNGLIDDIRVYSRALSSQDVAELISPPVIPEPSTSLLMLLGIGVLLRRRRS